MKARRLAMGVALLLVCSSVAMAQSAQVGQLAGTVHDATGGALSGATVTLHNQDRGVARQVVTDRQGRYLFAVVTPGRYTIIVRQSSFETATITDTLVEAEKTTQVPVELNLAVVQEATTVTGSEPVVDRTNATVQTRLRAAEFGKMPYVRSYQALIAQTPGLVYNADGNPNSHGALRSNNLFLFDGMNTTDPATGTVGNSLNFESIHEVLVRTASVSAEFGPGTGAIVDIITKSGTNRLQGSFKYLVSNDQWNAPNTTSSEVAGPDGTYPSLARTRFDRMNPTYSGTIGGPILPNTAWFFFAYERAEVTTPERQTNPAPGQAPQNYQQTTVAPFLNLRISAQLAPSHQVWMKIVESPTRGFINDYWGASAERSALTAQDQGGLSWAAQYSGVFGQRLTGEVMIARADSFINVVPFERSVLSDGAPYQDQIDGRVYNGATFDGHVRRPRDQASAALTYFMGAKHQMKFGVDWQDMRSESFYRFPSSSLFLVAGFDASARTFTPIARLDFDDDPSASTGSRLSLFVRDRMQLGDRMNLEAGLRVERHQAQSDIGNTTVDARTFSPRVSFSAAMDETGQNLFVASFGRYYDPILLGFSDAFAAVPQQTNYDLYVWNGATYQYDSRYEEGASAFQPNTEVRPRRMDEFTVGLEHQVGVATRFALRYVDRVWADFIDDVIGFNEDGSVSRVVQNVSEARRSYRGIEVSFDRRFAQNWTMSGSYTYSQTRGNHFGDDFTSIGDFVNETCLQSVDPGLGEPGGRIPCREVQANLQGTPLYDRPHAIKFNGAFVNRVGPVNLTTGFVGHLASKATYTKTRTLNVLQPNSMVPSGQTLTYYYDPRGTDRVPGLAATFDVSVEGVGRMGRSQAGVKLDIFNVLSSESKINVNNTAWCNSTVDVACGDLVDHYGLATSRGSFQAPRAIRLTFLVRWN
jgi:hypothetical protein